MIRQHPSPQDGTECHDVQFACQRTGVRVLKFVIGGNS